jgi:hypothetical protein
MKEDIEFHEIGKNTPYKVPDGFFENISEKTLQRSKEREQKHRKKIVLWKSMAVAASLAAVISIGYLILDFGIKQDSKQIVQEKQQFEQQIINQKQESIPKKIVPGKVITGENETEGLGDVLHDLSDEELLEIAAVYNADPFIGESEK